MRLRSTSAGYNVTVTTEPVRVPRRQWVAAFLVGVAVFLIPWTLYLTFTLPSNHVTHHYDLAWSGFDVGMAISFAVTGWAALRGSQWLAPFAALTAAMLLCDAWFDVVTSRPGSEFWSAVAAAVFVELPLAVLCGVIAYDTERFLAATVTRYRRRANITRA